MTLVRFDPFRDLTRLQARINRAFGDVTRDSDVDTNWGAWSPAVDIFEKDEKLVMKAELRGMNEKDIEVNVENGVLTLRGERKRENEVKNDSYHRVERSYGSFTRTFSLPTTVDVQKIQASYKDGVLEVVLPK